MEPENHYLSVKSHHNTTNIYVKKEIVISNINQIDEILNTKGGLNIKKSKFFELINLKDQQNAILKKINADIRDKEQSEFRFGSPC